MTQAAKATGALSLQKVLDMQEAGVEVESFVSEDMRMQMYSKEVRLTRTYLHPFCLSKPALLSPCVSSQQFRTACRVCACT